MEVEAVEEVEEGQCVGLHLDEDDG